jgi:hypothetical protein
MKLTYHKKFLRKYIWKRVFYERLTEPLHLNLLSLVVSIFGGFRSKVEFDLVLRQQHAFSILKSADIARANNIDEVTLLEFGVANGAGLMNICDVSRKVTEVTGVKFRIFGFDTGKGMPPPESYRDHPDLYQEGDFPMDSEALRKRLPANATLIIGELRNTLPLFLHNLSSAAPIGFVSIDVDYYSSTQAALGVFDGDAEQYLPKTLVYLDDLEDMSHNSWCGELLAVREFNEAHEMRKIEQHPFQKSNRVFRNARWIDHIFTLHMLDHPSRCRVGARREKVVLSNPYIS